MLGIPYRWLFPIILVFSSIGIYTVNSSNIDVWLIVLFGILGYGFMKLDCEPAPFILGFLLGPMLEENFRRAMLISRGDPSTFVTHPINAGFLLAAALIIMMAVPTIRRRKDVRPLIANSATSSLNGL